MQNNVTMKNVINVGLATALKKCGVVQVDFAAAINVTQQTVSRWIVLGAQPFGRTYVRVERFFTDRGFEPDEVRQWFSDAAKLSPIPSRARWGIDPYWDSLSADD